MAPRVPGPARNGTRASGVMVDFDFGSDATAGYVTAHEIGHLLGLNHTAESDGTHDEIDDTVECLSIEGRAERVGDGERQEVWIARYLAKYQPIMPDLNADFLRANLVFEFVPERALAVIEREDEFATRATKWAFGDDH